MAKFFKKNKTPKEPEKMEEEKVIASETEETTKSGSDVFSGNFGSNTHRILNSFYVSEKASVATGMNQYAFRIFKAANKSEVKKEVSKLFNVKVKSVKILNMPEKRRDLGKHPGFKSGFKKAIVVLEEGYSIGQAKP